MILLLSLCGCITNSKNLSAFEKNGERSPAVSQTIQFIGNEVFLVSPGIRYILFVANSPDVREVGSIEINSPSARDQCKIITEGSWDFKFIPNERFFLLRVNKDESQSYVQLKSASRDFSFNVMCTNSSLKPLHYKDIISILTQKLFREI